MREDDEHRYDDIIDLPHHVSRKHPQMPLLDRAAQFAPFAALTGHEAAIKETARLTEEEIELDENSKELLAMFETVKMMSKPLASPYKYVRDWFKAQFPNYDKPSANDTIKPCAKLLSAPNIDNYQAKQESEEAAGT